MTTKMKNPARAKRWTRSVNLPATVFHFPELHENIFDRLRELPNGSLITTNDHSMFVIDFRLNLNQLIDINGRTYMLCNTDEAMSMAHELTAINSVNVVIDEHNHILTVYDHITGNVHVVRYDILDKYNMN